MKFYKYVIFISQLMSDDKPILRMILAGVASVCAGGTTHPVDTVKVRL